MCYNVNTFFVMPTCHCSCTTTVVTQSSSIPVGTIVMVPAVSLSVQVFTPVCTCRMYSRILSRLHVMKQIHCSTRSSRQRVLHSRNEHHSRHSTTLFFLDGQ